MTLNVVLPVRWLLLTAMAASPLAVAPLSAQEASQAPQPAPQPSSRTTPPSATNTSQESLSDKEKLLLEKIRALKAPRWRSYGACRYDWSAWRLAADGVRTTSVQCGQSDTSESIAVFCDTFKVSQRAGSEAWSSWRLPLSTDESNARGGEDRMVAALCANAQPVPKPTPVKPGPESAAPGGKPAKPVKTTAGASAAGR